MKNHHIFLILTCVLSCNVSLGAEIPVTPEYPLDGTVATRSQIEHIRSLAEKLLSAEEIVDAKITVPSMIHHRNKNCATIHYPRITNSTHAVYREIDVFNSSWTDTNAPPSEIWSYEKKMTVIPVFNIDGAEYEIPYSSNLSRDTVAQILKLIVDGNVQYDEKSTPRSPLSISIVKITQIAFVDNIFSIVECKQPETSSCHHVYSGHIKDGKLIITEVILVHT